MAITTRKFPSEFTNRGTVKITDKVMIYNSDTGDSDEFSTVSQLTKIQDDAINALDIAKVAKVVGKSLILDTEITRLASVTNQTLNGLGGEATANKKSTINESDTEFPTSKAVFDGLALKIDKTSITSELGDSEEFVMSQKVVSDEITQLDSEVSLFKEESNLKDAIQDSKIKDIESIISTMNPNQSAQLSVSGRKIVSLPKNAANGGMSVKLEGLTAENLVVNGDFRNGTMGWNPIVVSRDLHTLQQNGLKITCGLSVATADLATYMPNNNFIAGNKYYIALFIDEYLQVLGGASLAMRHVVSGVPTHLASIPLKKGLTSVVVTSANTSAVGQYITLQGAGSSISPEDFYVIKHGIVLNLTETFGAANEPTKEQCDLIFSDYFEGVKSFEPTGRVRSVGKNVFNSTLEAGSLNDISGLPEFSFGNGVRSKHFTKIIPNTQYSLSNNLGYLNLAYWYDSNENFISRTTSPPYISPINAAYMKIRTSTAGAQNDLSVKFQLEKSSTATLYEPYKETSLYLTAPELRSNGAVKDEIRKGTNGYELAKRVRVSETVNEGVENIPQPLNFTFGWSQVGATTINSATQFTTAGTGGIIKMGGLPGLNKNVIVRIKGTVTVGSLYIRSSVSQTGQISLSGAFDAVYISNYGTSTELYLSTGINPTVNIEKLSIKVIDVIGTIVTPLKVWELGDSVHYTLATPEIIPISYGGVLNSAGNGTVYHEPVIADAGVYDTKMDILLTDYPISSIEEIIKHENGIDTYLNVATAVIAVDGLSFTHPNLTSGDLVLFTYAFDRESTNGNITASFYDSNVVKIDTVTGKAYRINEVVTNGLLTRTLTEV